MTQPQPQADQQLARTLASLVAAQAAARAALTAQAVAMAIAAARTFHGWYNPGAVGAWAAGLASRIEALQRAQASTTDAYLARALSDIVGGRVRPLGAVSVADLRSGVTHAGAYARGASAYRWQQSRLDGYAQRLIAATAGQLDSLPPPDLVSPIDAAVQRVASLADVDMQLADRAQSDAFLSANADKHDIRGYRRVIHPELSKGGTCGLCIAASDRVYKVGTLKALHSRCECTVLPIVGELDPGSGLNNLDLGTLYERARAHGKPTSREALKRTRYQIDEHGELGPVLTDGTFRTARTAKRAESGRAPLTELERLAAMRQIRERLDAALPRAQGLAKTDQRWAAYLHGLETRIGELDRQLAA